MAATLELPNPSTHVIQQGLGGMLPATGNIVINVASAADQFTPWGYNTRQRDAELRAFWPTENYFAGALFTTVAQYVAFGWSLVGPPRTTKLSQQVLNQVQFGGGYEALMMPFLIDYLTCDNGAFMEIVREDNTDPRSPCVSLNHLDSGRCIRTGIPEKPVLYIDKNGRWHELAWFNVVALTEMPSPVEDARGIGYSCLTRVLRAAQIMRDVAIVNQEKAAGRFTRQVHLVSGVQSRIIEDAMERNQLNADAKGLLRYVQPLILASLDPTARVSKETIDLASLPADYNEREYQEAYIITLAMAFGTDYANFAPLPSRSGGIGGAQQTKTANMRTRGKGPGLFMQRMTRVFNYHGILPSTVRFEFGEADIAEELERSELSKSRAIERETRIRSGEITTEVARQIAVDVGDLDERYLTMMRESNATQEVTVTSAEPYDPALSDKVKPGLPGPSEPPQATQGAGFGSGSAPARPPNSDARDNHAPISNQKRNPGSTVVERHPSPTNNRRGRT